jgi:hypothetical protein
MMRVLPMTITKFHSMRIQTTPAAHPNQPEITWQDFWWTHVKRLFECVGLHD